MPRRVQGRPEVVLVVCVDVPEEQARLLKLGQLSLRSSRVPRMDTCGRRGHGNSDEQQQQGGSRQTRLSHRSTYRPRSARPIVERTMSRAPPRPICAAAAQGSGQRGLTRTEAYGGLTMASSESWVRTAEERRIVGEPLPKEMADRVESAYLLPQRVAPELSLRPSSPCEPSRRRHVLTVQAR